jgi:hypothetical protein
MVSDDQWDRPWLITIELATGDPTGVIHAAGWDDPLRTPQKYIGVPKNKWGQTDWGRCRIEIEQWIRDVRRDITEWRRNVLQIAQTQYKGQVGPNEAFKHPYVLELAGPEPFPSVELLEMARTGDEGVLGIGPMSDRVKELLGPYLNPTRTVSDVHASMRDQAAKDAHEGSYGDESFEIVTGTTKADYDRFMEIAKRSGMKYPQAQLAWREHKEAVSGAAKEEG